MGAFNGIINTHSRGTKAATWQNSSRKMLKYQNVLICNYKVLPMISRSELPNL